MRQAFTRRKQTTMLAFRMPPRTALLALPSNLRVAVYQHHFRHFSVSTPKRFNLVDAAAAGPTLLLQAVHALGLPWCIALPATAVLVRSTFVYYLGTLPNRKAQARRAGLIPLANARLLWQLRKQAATLPVITHADVSGVAKLQRTYFMWEKWHTVSGDMAKQWGAARWTWRRFINFGILIAFTESVRRLCGAREGLLPLLLGPFQSLGRKILPELFDLSDKYAGAVPQEADRYMQMATKMRDAQQVQLDASTATDRGAFSGEGAFDPSIHAEGLQHTALGADAQAALQNHVNVVANNSYPWFDPTLQTEGFAWCTDLTLPDPTFMLPLALSASLAAATLLAPRVKGDVEKTPPAAKSEIEEHPSDPERPRRDLTEDTIIRRLADRPPPQTPWQKLNNTRLMEGITNAQRLYLCFSILMFFVALRMPAAVLLYFIPSTWTGIVQTRLLDQRYPLRPMATRCTRPIRVKHRKMWNETD